MLYFRVSPHIAKCGWQSHGQRQKGVADLQAYNACIDRKLAMTAEINGMLRMNQEAIRSIG
jgi:hypothetical protein